MPVEYSGIIREHTAVRTAAGLFDVSHMGQFEVTGPQALDLLQYITSNDASNLADNQAQYSALTTPEGTAVDDLLVYCLSRERFMLVVNAANLESDLEWIRTHNTFNAGVDDIDEAVCAAAGSDAPVGAAHSPRALRAACALTGRREADALGARSAAATIAVGATRLALAWVARAWTGGTC